MNEFLQSSSSALSEVQEQSQAKEKTLTFQLKESYLGQVHSRNVASKEHSFSQKSEPQSSRQSNCGSSKHKSILDDSQCIVNAIKSYQKKNQMRKAVLNKKLVIETEQSHWEDLLGTIEMEKELFSTQNSRNKQLLSVKDGMGKAVLLSQQTTPIGKNKLGPIMANHGIRYGVNKNHEMEEYKILDSKMTFNLRPKNLNNFIDSDLKQESKDLNDKDNWSSDQKISPAHIRKESPLIFREESDLQDSQSAAFNQPIRDSASISMSNVKFGDQSSILKKSSSDYLVTSVSQGKNLQTNDSILPSKQLTVQSRQESNEENKSVQNQVKTPSFDYYNRVFNHKTIEKMLVQDQKNMGFEAFNSKPYPSVKKKLRKQLKEKKQVNLSSPKINQPLMSLPLKERLLMTNIKDSEFMTSVSTIMLKKCQNPIEEHTELYERFQIPDTYSPREYASAKRKRSIKKNTLVLSKVPSEQKQLIDLNATCEGLSQSDLSKLVTKTITSALPGQIIKLPSTHIILQQLVIKNPIKIVGRPGTILQFNNGNIVCNFSESPFLSQFSSGMGYQNKDPAMKAIISEIQIFFYIDASKLPKKELRKNGSLVIPLIIIEKNTHLEVRDCGVKAVKLCGNPFEEEEELESSKEDAQLIVKNTPTSRFKQGGMPSEFGTDDQGMDEDDIEMIHDICFYINGDAFSEKCLLEHSYTDFCSSLSLKSSIISGFYEQVRGGINSSVMIEQCYMADAKNSIVSMVNPRVLEISQSSLTRTQTQSAINCKWLSDSDVKEFARTINIKYNQIFDNEQNGISLLTDTFSAHNIKINIEENKIYKNKKEGVFINSIVLSLLEFKANEITGNHGTGIWLKSVHQKSNKSNILIDECKIVQQKHGFGVYIYDCGVKINHCFINENKEGGIFIGNFEKPQNLIKEAISFLEKFPMIVQIEGCQITLNQGNGICVQDFWKGPILIIQSDICLNSQHGIQLLQKNFEPLSKLQLVGKEEIEKEKPKKATKNQIVPISEENLSRRALSVRPSISHTQSTGVTQQRQNQSTSRGYYHYSFSRAKDGIGIQENITFYLGGVYIKQGTKLYQNVLSGIAVNKVIISIDEDPESQIFDNGNPFQVYIPSEEGKQLLLGFDKALTDKRIVGVVGGPWGKIKAKRIKPFSLFSCCVPIFKKRSQSLRPRINSTDSQ